MNHAIAREDGMDNWVRKEGYSSVKRTNGDIMNRTTKSAERHWGRYYAIRLAPLAILILLFALGEVGARLVNLHLFGNPDMGLKDTMEVDPYLITRSNDAIEQEIPPKGQEFRVLILGPSVAYRFGEHLKSKPQADLDSLFFSVSGGRSIQIFNYGQFEHVIQQSVIVYALYGARVEPDIIISINGPLDMLEMLRSGRPGIPLHVTEVERSVRTPWKYAIERLFRSSQLVGSVKRYIGKRQKLKRMQDLDLATAERRLYLQSVTDLARMKGDSDCKYVAVLHPYGPLRDPCTKREERIMEPYGFRRDYMREQLHLLAGQLDSLAGRMDFSMVDASALGSKMEGVELYEDEVHINSVGHDLLLNMILAVAESDSSRRDSNAF